MRLNKIFLILLLIILNPRLYCIELIVDDFNDGNDINYLNGATWGIALGNATRTIAVTNEVNLGPETGYSYKFQWSGVTSQGDKSLHLFLLGPGSDGTINVFSYNVISFWLFTPDSNLKLEIQLGSLYSGQEKVGRVKLSDHLVTATSSWQIVMIPIEAFIRDNPDLDLTHLRYIGLNSAYDGLEYQSSGTVYIDDIYFSYQPHPPYRSIIYTGGDAGVQNIDDVKGDTILWYETSLSSFTTQINTIRVSSGCSIVWVSTPTNNLQETLPGTTCYFIYKFINKGNFADTIGFQTEKIEGEDWSSTTLWDKNKNELYDSNDIVVSSFSKLLPESTFFLILAVYIPSDAVEGASTTVKLSIKANNASGIDDNWSGIEGNPLFPSNDDLLEHIVQVKCIKPNIRVVKETDKSEIFPGEIFTSTITVANIGTSAASNVSLVDVVPMYSILEAVTVDGGSPTIEYYYNNTWSTTFSTAAEKFRCIWNTLPANTTYYIYTKFKVK